MSASDVVSLVVDGRAYEDWTSYDIDSNLLIDADAFTLTVQGFASGDLGLFTPYQRCELRVNDRLQMVGYVEVITPANGRDSGSTLTVAGRSIGAVLVQGSPIMGRYRNQTILQLALTLCAPYGIEVVTTDASRAIAAGKPGARRSPQIDTVLGKTGISIDDLQPQPGDSVWGFLQGLCEKLDLHLWMTADGKLCISRPTYDSESLYSLFRARPNSPFGTDLNNVIEGTYTGDWQNRVSHLTGIGQTTVTRERTIGVATIPEVVSASFTYTATDAEVAALVYKPQRQSFNVTSRARLIEAVDREMAQRKFDSFEATYIVAGHSQSGVIWEPDTLVQVYDEVLEIDRVLYVVGRRFTRSRDGGTRTELRLRSTGVWLAA